MTTGVAVPERVSNFAPAVGGRPRICFVMPNIYGVIANDPRLTRFGGGAERQMTLVAKELARRGFSVSVVAMNHGQKDAIEHDGVRVFRAFAPEEGCRGLRFVHPRMTRVWSAMTRANADIYVQRCADSFTGVAAAWCRAHGRSFVFSTASDADCEATLSNLRTARERVLFRYGLRNATRVIAQTRVQQQLLQQGFGIESVRIGSCAASVAAIPHASKNRFEKSETNFLWVGRFTRNKRLELFMDLAESLPQFHFAVAGSPYVEDEYASQLFSRAATLPNLRMLGQVGRDALAELYESAAALVCTSRCEGFPNTFLEAWSNGAPVITTVDPDNLVSRNDLGLVGVEAATLADACKFFAGSAETRIEYSNRVSEYFRAHHTVDAIVDRYEELMEELPWRTNRRK